MEEVEMVDVFIAGVRWSVPQPVYESILAAQAELAGQTERENGYEARIAELEGLLKMWLADAHKGSSLYEHTVKALRGEGENVDR